MTRKIYTLQAMDAQGAMLMDIQVGTRAAETLAMREGFQMCARNGGGWLRRRTEGAQGWGVYRVTPNNTHARLLHVLEKPEVIARFDAWLATGGTYRGTPWAS
jgi:hypothetical protein